MSDLIDRQAAIEWVNSLMDVQKYYHPNSKSTRFPLEEVIDVLQQVPSAQPKLQPTCNLLANDCISRQAAIDAVEKESQVDGAYGYMDTKSIVDLLNDLPSAQQERKVGKTLAEEVERIKREITDIFAEQMGVQPSAQPEHSTDEWCTDCKEYDHERNCCPRFNRVIRTTLQDAQRTGRWIFETLDGTPGYRPTVMFCSKCGRVSIADYNYCPNCGARMEAEE